jgi:hypothetical protein
MSPFILQLLASVTVSTVLAAALVWVTKSWISERLKSSIRHEYDQKLETHKAQLSAHSAVETERLRSQLSMQATEHAVRFQGLHEKRAAVIAEMYSLLVEAYWKASSFASPMEWAGEPDKQQKYTDAMNSFASFYQYFDKNQIYLPPAICAQVDTFVREMRKMVIGFGVYLRLDEKTMPLESVNKKHDAWIKAWEYMEKEVPIARTSLEAELRAILDGSARALS